MPNDGLPDRICGPCIAKLDETSEFIDKCLRTQKMFEDIIAGVLTLLHFVIFVDVF